MSVQTDNRVVLRYQDKREGFRGWAVLDGTARPLAAGGFRVQPGLSEQVLVDLAAAMSLKQRLLGLAVDGAKAGIDYDPDAPGKHEAMRRFLRFLRPHLLERLSLGSDMGTGWTEIEALARAEGIPSVKIAVARAQGLDEAEFSARIGLLDTDVGGLTLGQRRAGHAVAAAALAAVGTTGTPGRNPRAAVQGFGTLGRAAALSLAEAGVAIAAVADEHACLMSTSGGLGIERLLAAPARTPVASLEPTHSVLGPPGALFETRVDVVVLAACGDALSPAQAGRLPARAVVVGANLGLSAPAEAALHRRGVTVVPDFVGGCGGSASMDALFGPPERPTAPAVLEQMGVRVQDLVHRVLELARREGIPQRAAATALCHAEQADPGSPRPYGRWALARDVAGAAGTAGTAGAAHHGRRGALMTAP